MSGEQTLKDRILSEMTTDYKNTLEKNFDLAKQFIRVTPEGRVDVLMRDKLTGEDKISLYFIGKLYAKEVGHAATDHVTYKELAEELGIGMGSLMPWVKGLRDKKIIKAVKDGVHTMSVGLVEQTLKKIHKKLDGK